MVSKGKHMSIDDRCAIKFGLDQGHSFKEIGRKLGKDCTTISKEVRARRRYVQKGSFGQRFNDCKGRFGCELNDLCPDKRCRNKRCCNCTQLICRTICSNYVKEDCHMTEKPPYVCNACVKRYKCTLGKWLYSSRAAQEEYEYVLNESRSGIALDNDAISRLDEMLSPSILKGQSIHHVFVNSNAEAICTERTAYKYIDMGLLRARNIDMPRVVRFRKRKIRNKVIKADAACRNGRTYGDYQVFLAENNYPPIVEMDTVHGSLGGKCLLTLYFVSTHYMITILMDACTTRCVAAAFTKLRNVLGNDLFASSFPVYLTDRGSEFSDPLSIEFDDEGEERSRVFYCDPQNSQQKGALEVNHEFIRRILPKGASFDEFSQEQILYMMNHINSYSRPALNDLSPYKVMEHMYGQEILKKLGATLIPTDEITLRPSLLK